MVAQIEFTEWTKGNHLRHSKFVGLRDDKKATDVIKEATESLMRNVAPNPSMIRSRGSQTPAPKEGQPNRLQRNGPSRALIFLAHRVGALSWHEIISQSIVEVDEYGCAIVHDDNFARIIKGIDVTRIRVCEICGTIFWAGRYDSPCYSSNCADKRR